MNLQDPFVLGALAIAAFLIYRRWSANKAASTVAAVSAPLAPLDPVKHEGHALYEAFEACKASAIGDTLKTTLGQHGAGLFMGELGQAVTGKPTGTTPPAAEAPKS
jgi:hypothetical protein